MNNRYAVIMAGGRGERFWPKSRSNHPKHLLRIGGDQTLLEQALNRLEGVVPIENVFIITNIAQEQAIRYLCPQLAQDQVIAEPVGRDTAAAVGLAMVVVRQRDPQGVFAVLPADAVIDDTERFGETLVKAFNAAKATRNLFTIGIKPRGPETGYGYLERGAALDGSDDGVFRVSRFVEKPNLETAKQYLKSGQYFWNAGMFVWDVSVLGESLERHCTGLYQELQALESHLELGEDLPTVLERLYPSLEKISIDYALMEKADNVAVVEGDFGWDDVGSWPAAANYMNKDAAGNALEGSVVIDDSEDNIVVSEGSHLVALIGLKDLMVIHTKDATLVCPKDKAQEVKNLVKKLANNPDYQKYI